MENLLNLVMSSKMKVLKMLMNKQRKIKKIRFIQLEMHLMMMKCSVLKGLMARFTKDL